MPPIIVGQSQRSFNDVLRDVFGNDFRSWSLAVNVSYPIGTSQADAALAQGRVQRQQGQVQMRQLEIAITAQVREAARDISTTLQRVQATRLSDQIGSLTSQIKHLELQVGNVSQKLSLLETDLALHQKRLDKLNALFRLQTQRFEALERSYRLAVQRLDFRLVSMYKNGEPSAVTPALVAEAAREALGTELSGRVQLSPDQLQAALDPWAFVRSRTIPGGPAPETVLTHVGQMRETLRRDTAWRARAEAQLERATAERRERAAAFA